MHTKRQVLVHSFPWKSTNDLASLEYVPTHYEERGDFDGEANADVDPSITEPVVLRLVCWRKHENTGTRYISDIKEQAVRLDKIVPECSLQEFSNCVDALKDVVQRALCSENIETAMPDDFMNFSPLLLRKRDKESIVRALKFKSRLGHWLPA